MNNKISDLQIYGVVAFCRVLKQKFPEENFEFDFDAMYSEGDFISIWKYPKKSNTEGALVLEVYVPGIHEYIDSSVSEEEERNALKIGFFISGISSTGILVKQSAFDNDNFINVLKELIGSYPPRKIHQKLSSEDFNEESIISWLKELLHEKIPAEFFCKE